MHHEEHASSAPLTPCGQLHIDGLFMGTVRVVCLGICIVLSLTSSAVLPASGEVALFWEVGGTPGASKVTLRLTFVHAAPQKFGDEELLLPPVASKASLVNILRESNV